MLISTKQYRVTLILKVAMTKFRRRCLCKLHVDNLWTGFLRSTFVLQLHWVLATSWPTCNKHFDWTALKRASKMHLYCREDAKTWRTNKTWTIWGKRKYDRAAHVFFNSPNNCLIITISFLLAIDPLRTPRQQRFTYFNDNYTVKKNWFPLNDSHLA